MRHVLTILVLVMMVAGCEKPATEEVADPDSTSLLRRLRHGDESRSLHLIPDTPESLRTQLEETMTIESLEEREKAVAEVAWNAMEIDMGIAHESFGRLSADRPERLRLVRHYAMRLAEQNPEEAMGWANTLETEKEIAAAMSHIALEIAETEPIRAAQILAEYDITGRDHDVALVQIIQRWAAKSPADAGTWVSSFPAGEAREASIKVIAEQWLPRDVKAAFDWFDSLRDEKLRMEAARAMEGIILQQGTDVQDAWRQLADPRILNEFEQQREQAIQDVGDNIPPITGGLE